LLDISSPSGALHERAKPGDGATANKRIDLARTLVGIDGLGVGDEAGDVMIQQDAVSAEQLARPTDRLPRSHGACRGAVRWSLGRALRRIRHRAPSIRKRRSSRLAASPGASAAFAHRNRTDKSTPSRGRCGRCKKQKAKLVIAKLDRLSRNLAFIATLMESGVEFVAVDIPHANKLTVHILAAVAQHEREMISERTKAALQAAKKRGQRLGNPGIAEAAKLGRAALKANARRFAANVRPIIDEIVRAGATSHNAIAAKLNERNVRTARGGVWTHVQVGAILHPFDGASVAAP
jgi:Resolvase, N terminal domain